VLGALEIKWSDRFANGEEKPKSLIAFCRENNLKQAFMTSRTKFSTAQFGDLEIFHYPTSFLCFGLGMMAGMLEMIRHNFTVDPQLAAGLAEPAKLTLFAQDLIKGFAASIYLKEDLRKEIGKAMPSVLNNLISVTSVDLSKPKNEKETTGKIKST